jgi:type I restriction enzyme S subunit
MSERIEFRLSYIIDLIGGGTPKTSVPEYWNGDIPWLSVKDFNNDDRYVYTTEKSITQAGLDNSSTKLLAHDDIIISARGTVGELAMIPFPMAFNQSCYGVRGKKGVIVQPYLYYLLKDRIRLLKSQTHGSVFDTITRDTFANIEVSLPSIEEQQTIADTLTALDDRIAVNRTINHHLGQMTQTIFKSWFVDFGPFGGVMPDDWREGTLGDICVYNSERVAVSALTFDTYISTENMSANKGGFVTAASLPTVSQTTSFTIGDTLVSNIRPYFKKIVYCGFTGGCSTDVLCFRPHNANISLYVYNVLCSDSFFDYMVAGSKGTKMPRGDKQQIMNYNVTIPSNAALDEFTNCVKPMNEKRLLLTMESVHLAALRDTLLPRLISGELSIADLGNTK